MVLEGEWSHWLRAPGELGTPRSGCAGLCRQQEEEHPWVLPLPGWVNFNSELDLSEPLSRVCKLWDVSQGVRMEQDDIQSALPLVGVPQVPAVSHQYSRCV